MKMENKLKMLEDSKIMPIFLSFLKFALGETVFEPTSVDPWIPWPFP